MKIGGPDPACIDGRLWAFLRIIYSQSEEDLLAHGYDPMSLQVSVRQCVRRGDESAGQCATVHEARR